jgi:hypothetical protein
LAKGLKSAGSSDFPLTNKNMATIIVFASSLSVASVLVGVKAFELRRGRKNAALGLLCRLDSKFDRLMADIKFRMLQLVQSVRYILFVQSKIFFKNLLHQVMEKIIQEFRAKQNTIMMGHKEISSNGSASFYLKKITEDKSNGEKGKIEDSL